MLIISDANFSKSLSYLNELNDFLKDRTSQMPAYSRQEIITIVKGNLENSERVFMNVASNESDPKYMLKIKDFYGADFDKKIRAVREASRLFLSNLFDKGVPHKQAKRALGAFIDKPESIKFGRTDDYHACINIAYYCYNLALNQCFISDSADPPMLNLCLNIAELGLIVDLLKCDNAYL